MHRQVQGVVVSKSKKVIAYIDGYNLYYGMKSAGFRKFFWLDVHQLAGRFLKPDQSLEATKFFTSRIDKPRVSALRQADYLDALKIFGVTLIEGRHGDDPERCVCGRTHRAKGEKMTDVNIALEIVRDAALDAFETAFLVTGDADQVPTIKLIHELYKTKKVIVLFPPNRKSNHLKSLTTTLNINEYHLRNAQLPPTVRVPNSQIILSRPAYWS